MRRMPRGRKWQNWATQPVHLFQGRIWWDRQTSAVDRPCVSVSQDFESGLKFTPGSLNTRGILHKIDRTLYSDSEFGKQFVCWCKWTPASYCPCSSDKRYQPFLGDTTIVPSSVGVSRSVSRQNNFQSTSTTRHLFLDNVVILIYKKQLHFFLSFKDMW